jgi:hypothetical protein
MQCLSQAYEKKKLEELFPEEYDWIFAKDRTGFFPPPFGV